MTAVVPTRLPLGPNLPAMAMPQALQAAAFLHVGISTRTPKQGKNVTVVVLTQVGPMLVMVTMQVLQVVTCLAVATATSIIWTARHVNTIPIALTRINHFAIFPSPSALVDASV